MTRPSPLRSARLGPLRFTVIDTAGLEEATDESLQGRMRALTERAVDMADVCLFLVDDAPLQRKLAFYEEFPAG